MKRANIVSRLKRRALPLLAGAMASVSACGGDGPGVVDPPPTNQSPVASLSIQPREGYVPLMTTYDCSSSTDPDGSIVKYTLDFGDGSSASGPTAQHMYSTPGSFSATCTVEDNKGAKNTKSLEVLARDASPSVNVSDFSFNEDEQYNLDLTGKATSPVYGTNGLRVIATSPNLEVTVNGSQASVKNKTKDWNGSTYIDFTVEDQDGRKVTKRTNVAELPQTDVRGYFKHALTGNRVSGAPIVYGSRNTSTGQNGDFELQVQNSTGDLEVNDSRYCRVRVPINANGQDIALNNIVDELIEKYVDPATPGESNCHFLKTYTEQGRWSEIDVPLKVGGIYTNPPSQQYADSITMGVITKWNTEVKKWLPEGRKRNLLQLSNSNSKIRVVYDDNGPYFNWGPTGESFKEGFMGFPNQAQALEGISRAAPHEGSNALFGSNRLLSPYLNHVGHSPSLVNLPALLESNVAANKYSTKVGYEKYLVGEQP